MAGSPSRPSDRDRSGVIEPVQRVAAARSLSCPLPPYWQSKRVIRIGPAGWKYKDWNGVVYPNPKPRAFDELAYLSTSMPSRSTRPITARRVPQQQRNGLTVLVAIT